MATGRSFAEYVKSKCYSGLFRAAEKYVEDEWESLQIHTKKGTQDWRSPDYADVFEDTMIFRWDSKIGRGIDSSYMKEVLTALRKHLLVKKSDAETNFLLYGFI